MNTIQRPDDRVQPEPTLSTPHRIAVTVLADMLARWRAAATDSPRPHADAR